MCRPRTSLTSNAMEGEKSPNLHLHGNELKINMIIKINLIKISIIQKLYGNEWNKNYVPLFTFFLSCMLTHKRKYIIEAWVLKLDVLP